MHLQKAAVLEYKYLEHNIFQVCLLDFQLVRYGSPALDLANLIYCCTSRDQRTEHLVSLLSTYHETLYSRLVELTPEDHQITSLMDRDKLWEMLVTREERLDGLGMYSG